MNQRGLPAREFDRLDSTQSEVSSRQTGSTMLREAASSASLRTQWLAAAALDQSRTTTLLASSAS
jgi:hypothetical protein